jgi:uncharacterized membrane protein YcaP (DUF421 family)
VKATPTLLVYKGEMLHRALKKECVNEDEIHPIIREKGLGSVQETDAVVLETDGSLTVVKRLTSLQTPTMRQLKSQATSVRTRCVNGESSGHLLRKLLHFRC